MRKTSLAALFAKSIYSPKDIAKFRLQGIGKTILYVFLLMLLYSAPGMYHFASITISAVGEAKAIVENDLPDFTISGGELSSEVAEPIEIKKPEFTVVFDSTGETAPGDLDGNGQTIAFLKHELAMKTGAAPAQTFSYDVFAGQKIDNAAAVSFIENIDESKVVFLPVFFTIFYLFTAGLGFIKISIFAAIGLLYANLMGRNLVYRHSWRLTAFAITLPTVFFSIMTLLNTTVPGSTLIDWTVTLIMIYLSIRELPKANKAA